MIDHFDGDNAFLSNFFPTAIEWDGARWKSAEHIYQAEKTKMFGEKLSIFLADTPHRAKRIGRDVTLRSDWEQVKLPIMGKIVYEKFTQSDLLHRSLLATGEEELVEGNHWNDTFWGVCRGEGENWLGIILMHVRGMLQARDKYTVPG